MSKEKNWTVANDSNLSIQWIPQKKIMSNLRLQLDNYRGKTSHLFSFIS